MRIRKNNSAKISSLLYATNLKPPAGLVINHQSIISHVVVTTNCELNQSPWDVMTTFSPPSSPPPPPPPQVSKTSAASGIDEYSSSVDTISISERKELNDAGETETVWYNYDDGSTDKATAGPLPTTCCKTDGKSWQCRKKAAPGSSMCQQYHLPLTKSYTKKPTEAAQCRPRRPKKASGSSTSTNPYEFYYYSGFGPRWGKRRGGVGDDTTNGCVITKTVHHDHQEIEPSLSSSHIIKDDSNYVEYEDDEEEEEEEINEKKRARKSIKARSLKSLM